MNGKQRETSRRAKLQFLQVLIIGLGTAACGMEAKFEPALVVNDAAVPFPQGYRNWMHVKSGVNGAPGADNVIPGRFGGIYYIYANKTALKGYETGRFPIGSVIVSDLQESRHGPKGIQSIGRKSLAVMIRRRAGASSAGGWEFEEFLGNSQTLRGVTDARNECSSCHQAAEKTGFVFSKIR